MRVATVKDEDGRTLLQKDFINSRREVEELIREIKKSSQGAAPRLQSARRLETTGTCILFVMPPPSPDATVLPASLSGGVDVVLTGVRRYTAVRPPGVLCVFAVPASPAPAHSLTRLPSVLRLGPHTRLTKARSSCPLALPLRIAAVRYVHRGRAAAHTIACRPLRDTHFSK